MRIDLPQVNRMSFSAKGQGEPKLRWMKYKNMASPYLACLSRRSRRGGTAGPQWRARFPLEMKRCHSNSDVKQRDERVALEEDEPFPQRRMSVTLW